MTVQFSLRSCSAPFFCLLIGCGPFVRPALGISLVDAERELLRANPDIALAHAAVEGAHANVAIAGAQPNPTLNVQTTQFSPIAGLGAGRISDKALDTIVGISLPIERGDKAALRREAALEQLAGTRFDLAEQRRQQRLALSNAYYDLKLAEEKLVLARETSGLAAEALRAAERRVAAGDLARVDRIRLEVDALRTANDVTAATSDAIQARVQLAALLGRVRARERVENVSVLTDDPRITDLTASDPWPPMSSNTATDDALASLTRRADVAGADARIAAAAASRAVARSLRTRDVTVGAQLERVPATTPGLTFGISVSFPLFARYGYEGEIAKAESDYSAAVLTRNKMLAQAESDVGRALAALDGARRRLQNFEKDIVPAARLALDAIEFAYARGAAPLTDVLDARRTWRATQVDLSQARADHAKALALWRAATEWEVVS